MIDLYGMVEAVWDVLIKQDLTYNKDNAMCVLKDLYMFIKMKKANAFQAYGEDYIELCVLFIKDIWCYYHFRLLNKVIGHWK